MKNNTLKRLILLLSVLLVILIAVAVTLEITHKGHETSVQTSPTQDTQPEKQLSDYTWEEYEAMSPGEKERFFDSFESVEAFDAWMQRVNPTEGSLLPWEREGKDPASYTWEEYEALTPEEKELFYDSFASKDAFDAWMQRANPKVLSQADTPWANGGKAPRDYTWAEYEALSPAEKELFFDSFESAEAFDAWMKQATASADSEIPWEQGGKEPPEYTLEEYEALSAVQKAAFAAFFENAEDFDQWMEKAQEEAEPDAPWEAEGKSPSDYTWEEYEALSPSEKELFFDSFESVEAFDRWMTDAQAKQEENTWEDGEKSPEEYTWEEYEALSPEEKELFFDSFESVDAFRAWMERVNPS